MFSQNLNKLVSTKNLSFLQSTFFSNSDSLNSGSKGRPPLRRALEATTEGKNKGGYWFTNIDFVWHAEYIINS